MHRGPTFLWVLHSLNYYFKGTSLLRQNTSFNILKQGTTQPPIFTTTFLNVLSRRSGGWTGDEKYYVKIQGNMFSV